jgi:protein-S-isoprenylcysteine O-methyltransferase Ste14
MNGIDVCGYLWEAFVVVWVIWALRAKKTLESESFASRLSYGVLLVAGFYMLFSGHVLTGWWKQHPWPESATLEWVGAAVTAAGIGIAVWARMMLGANWSGTITVKVGHELIRRGPYRLVRHPIYTGLVLAAIGTAIARDRWCGLVAVLVMWLGYTMKRLKEEKYMRATFGAQYEEYCRHSGAILPFVNL